MKVICAWCEQEGRPSFIGLRAPLLDERPTHGICRTHLDDYLKTCGVGTTPGGAVSHKVPGPDWADSHALQQEHISGSRALVKSVLLTFRRLHLGDCLEKIGLRQRNLASCSEKRVASSWW
ncbi:hypothetical protein YTPLAS18_38070 [Nitrospira sp.]|nr:hypothetical protein YTPLAS18_38070 [Nitrospira sp.]